MADKISPQNHDIITIAHELSRHLTIIGVKVQAGQEIQQSELQTIPILANYADKLFAAVMPLISEQSTRPEPQDRKAKKKKPQPAPTPIEDIVEEDDE